MLSTSQDSFLSYPAYLEEGVCSPILSEVMVESLFGDSMFIPSPQTTPPNIFLTTAELMATKIPRDRSSTGSSSRDSGVGDSSRASRSHERGAWFSLSHQGMGTDPLQEYSHDSELLQELWHSNFSCGQESVALCPEVEDMCFGKEGDSISRAADVQEKSQQRKKMQFGMHNSISEGMEGTMNRVVLQHKQSFKGKRSSHHCQPLRVGSIKKRGRGKAVESSILERKEKMYPMLVFATSTKKRSDEETAREESGDVETPLPLYLRPHAKGQSSCTTETTPAVIGQARSAPAVIGQARSAPAVHVECTLEHTTSPAIKSPSYHTFDLTPPLTPCSHHKTTRSVPVVQFKSELIVHPQFQSTADLYPSFTQSDYFSSEMDILPSLLQLGIKSQMSIEPDRLTPEEEPDRLTQEEEPDRLTPEEEPAASLTSTNSCLLSPSHHRQLIQRAMNTVKQKALARQDKQFMDMQAEPSQNTGLQEDSGDVGEGNTDNGKAIRRRSSMAAMTRIRMNTLPQNSVSRRNQLRLASSANSIRELDPHHQDPSPATRLYPTYIPNTPV